MTAGASGSFGINGTNFTLQPETGRWLERQLRGYDGNGRPVYSALREFELKWGYLDASEFKQVVDFFNTIGATGSVVVDLPKWAVTPWQFYSYSGCYISEPSVDVSFEEHWSSVLVVVSGIRT